MLLLTFYVNECCFVIDSRFIKEIIPKIHARIVPMSPPFFKGMINVSSKALPLIDFSVLIDNTPAPISFSTRTIILENPVKDAHPLEMALLAEKVFETKEFDRSAFTPIEMMSKQHPFLTHTLLDQNVIVNLVDVAMLFSFLAKEMPRG